MPRSTQAIPVLTPHIPVSALPHAFLALRSDPIARLRTNKFINKNSHLPSLSQQLSQDSFCLPDTKDIRNCNFSNSRLPVCILHCCTLNVGSQSWAFTCAGNCNPTLQAARISASFKHYMGDSRETRFATKIILRNYLWKGMLSNGKLLTQLCSRKAKTVSRLPWKQKQHTDKLFCGTRNQPVPSITFSQPIWDSGTRARSA